MDYSFNERLKNAWNAFSKRGPDYIPEHFETSLSYRPDRVKISRGNERSIINSIYNRIALDTSSININHVRVDENDNFKEIIKSDLNNVLSLDANMDQTGKQFIQDIVMSMFDEGCVAVVPVDTSINPLHTDSYDILTMRCGKIVQWYPTQVKVNLYNDRLGKKQDVIIPKRMCAIIENPFYSVMNEPNSTLRRLIRKMNLLDNVDEQAGANKLDLIIQLPYTIKSQARQDQAEKRRKEIEAQLIGSKYGIAYTDGTEHITQLNRPVDNSLAQQVKDLKNDLYNQLSLTDTILNGTANEQTMTNYYTRTIEPILDAITDEMNRKFLTKTARSQGQSIKYLRNPFKIIPVTQIADIADKFTRNEILTSNEVRGLVGYKPVNTQDANELRNKNLNKPKEAYETENFDQEDMDDEDNY